jgi:hypothetical protein
MRVTNSLVLGLTGIDPELFRKYRRRKTDPKLNEYFSERKGYIEYDSAELIKWFEIHMPGKADILKTHVRERKNTYENS